MDEHAYNKPKPNRPCTAFLAINKKPFSSLSLSSARPALSSQHPRSSSSRYQQHRSFSSSSLVMMSLHHGPPPKGILFDMDGTLTDSDSLHYETYRDTLLKHAPEHLDGKPLERAYYDKHLSGSANEIIVPKLLPHWEPARMKELWLSKEALYRERSIHMKPLEGVLRILDWCDEMQIPKNIVTNAPRIDAEHTLETLKLRHRFGEIIIGEECTRPKPFPDPYLTGLAKLGLEPHECIAFEDSFSGLKSAVDAGLRTVGVLTGRAEGQMLAAGAFMEVKNFDDEKLWAFLMQGR